MTWIIGIDLRPLSNGALEFGTWLAANAAAPEGTRFIPVHVLEQDHLLAVLRVHHLDEVVAAARDASKTALERHGHPEWLADLRIVQALRAEESLEAARAAAGADGTVIGRAAGSRERRVVRLGRVARRLLRALPSPVKVLQGNIAEEAIAFAEAQRSPLLVVGARRRSGVDRVLVPSIGREVAATAGVPVAVIPSSG